jgi:hypothetical protein
MAYNEPDASDQIDESADTASFRRFVEEDERRPAPADSGRNFRILTLGIAAVVLIALVVLLLR